MGFNGYKEAAKIDAVFNDLLKRNPITKENSLKWMNLCRTISTTCDIINELCKEELERR